MTRSLDTRRFNNALQGVVPTFLNANHILADGFQIDYRVGEAGRVELQFGIKIVTDVELAEEFVNAGMELISHNGQSAIGLRKVVK